MQLARPLRKPSRFFGQYKEMESAGAVMVESEVVAAGTLAEISKRVTLSTVSLGSGSGGDIDYLFQADITGQTKSRPRHGRAFADLYAMQKAMDAERVRALAAFKASVADGSFPDRSEIVETPEPEMAAFLDYLDKNA